MPTGDDQVAHVLPERCEHEPVDINAVVADVCALMAGCALLRGAVLSSRLGSTPCLVAGDRFELMQVLTNLAANALDAVANVAAGTRAVDLMVVAPSASSFAIAVVDTGRGIGGQPPSKASEWPPAAMLAEGRGLGLDIASSIVEAHGGSLCAGNNRNGGAHFVVLFPRAYKTVERSVTTPEPKLG